MIGFYFNGGGGGKFQVPVNPEEFTVTYPGNNKKVETVGIGEINILKDPKLAEFSLTFLFPGDDGYSFVTGPWKKPDACVTYFKKAMTDKRSLRFSVSEFGFNMRVSVEKVVSTRKAGDHESISCTVTFAQYKTYGARVLTFPMTTTTAATQASTRSNDKPTASSYTVKPGDSFWRIAQQQLGNGSRYNELAQYNGMTFTATIHPGDVLKLPPASSGAGSGSGQGAAA
ncbi:MAG: LysM peptidoglycan-binding domain-containing protein [Oscillospiraceae bacterium]